MRTAILVIAAVGAKAPTAKITNVNDGIREFKAVISDPKAFKTIESIELWTSDRGIIKRKNLHEPQVKTSAGMDFTAGQKAALDAEKAKKAAAEGKAQPEPEPEPAKAPKAPKGKGKKAADAAAEDTITATEEK